MWKISKIAKNTYRITQNEYFIEFKADCELEINLDSFDMSKDGVIFIPHSCMTPNEENPIIGNAYIYNGYTCINRVLISVIILNSNVNNPKRYLDSYFACF